MIYDVISIFLCIMRGFKFFFLSMESYPSFTENVIEVKCHWQCDIIPHGHVFCENLSRDIFVSLFVKELHGGFCMHEFLDLVQVHMSIENCSALIRFSFCI
jgi:hypothetical protein